LGKVIWLTKNEYDWKITIWKAMKVFVFGGIAELVVWLTNLPYKTETTILIIAVLTAILNWYKNKDLK
jgi:hypothetical protein